MASSSLFMQRFILFDALTRSGLLNGSSDETTTIGAARDLIETDGALRQLKTISQIQYTLNDLHRAYHEVITEQTRSSAKIAKDVPPSDTRSFVAAGPRKRKADELERDADANPIIDADLLARRVDECFLRLRSDIIQKIQEEERLHATLLRDVQAGEESLRGSLPIDPVEGEKIDSASISPKASNLSRPQAGADIASHVFAKSTKATEQSILGPSDGPLDTLRPRSRTNELSSSDAAAAAVAAAAKSSAEVSTKAAPWVNYSVPVNESLIHGIGPESTLTDFKNGLPKLPSKFPDTKTTSSSSQGDLAPTSVMSSSQSTPSFAKSLGSTYGCKATLPAAVGSSGVNGKRPVEYHYHHYGPENTQNPENHQHPLNLKLSNNTPIAGTLQRSSLASEATSKGKSRDSSSLITARSPSNSIQRTSDEGEAVSGTILPDNIGLRQKMKRMPGMPKTQDSHESIELIDQGNARSPVARKFTKKEQTKETVDQEMASDSPERQNVTSRGDPTQKENKEDADNAQKLKVEEKTIAIAAPAPRGRPPRSSKLEQVNTHQNLLGSTDSHEAKGYVHEQKEFIGGNDKVSSRLTAEMSTRASSPIDPHSMGPADMGSGPSTAMAIAMTEPARDASPNLLNSTTIKDKDKDKDKDMPRRSGRKRRDTLKSLDMDDGFPASNHRNARSRVSASARGTPHTRSTAATPTPSIPNPPIPQSKPGYILATRNFPRTANTLLASISSHRLASLFSKPITDREAPSYHQHVYAPQDLKSIKAAINAGGRAVNAILESMNEESNDEPQVWVPYSDNIVPPRGIVNAMQLEKELMRVFANAVMFNPDISADQKIGPRTNKARERRLELLRERGIDFSSNTADAPDAVKSVSSKTGNAQADFNNMISVERSIVADARGIARDVQDEFDTWHEAERQEPLAAATAVIEDGAKIRGEIKDARFRSSRSFDEPEDGMELAKEEDVQPSVETEPHNDDIDGPNRGRDAPSNSNIADASRSTRRRRGRPSRV